MTTAAVASPRQNLSVEWLRVLLIRRLAWPNTYIEYGQGEQGSLGTE
jgi:hypothetical protein